MLNDARKFRKSLNELQAMSLASPLTKTEHNEAAKSAIKDDYSSIYESNASKLKSVLPNK